MRATATVVGLLLLAGGCSSDGDGTPTADGSGKRDLRISGPDGAEEDGFPLDCENPKTYYPDRDGDGWGETAGRVQSCVQPEGYITTPGDCADGDARAHPKQTGFFTEPVTGKAAMPFDYDCNTVIETEVDYPAHSCLDKPSQDLCNASFAKPAWWGTSPPECGETRALLERCQHNGQILGPRCDPVKGSERTQACR